MQDNLNKKKKSALKQTFKIKTWDKQSVKLCFKSNFKAELFKHTISVLNHDLQLMLSINSVTNRKNIYSDIKI